MMMKMMMRSGVRLCVCVCSSLSGCGDGKDACF